MSNLTATGTRLCGLVRLLADSELEHLLSSQPLEGGLGAAELVGLSDHMPYCAECSARLEGLLDREVLRWTPEERVESARSWERLRGEPVDQRNSTRPALNPQDVAARMIEPDDVARESRRSQAFLDRIGSFPKSPIIHAFSGKSWCAVDSPQVAVMGGSGQACERYDLALPSVVRALGLDPEFESLVVSLRVTTRRAFVRLVPDTRLATRGALWLLIMLQNAAGESILGGPLRLQVGERNTSESVDVRIPMDEDSIADLDGAVVVTIHEEPPGEAQP